MGDPDAMEIDTRAPQRSDLSGWASGTQTLRRLIYAVVRTLSVWKLGSAAPCRRAPTTVSSRR